jgi:hypothetical protein
MFVRYRKIVADGHEPLGVAAQLDCRGKCRSRYPSRDGRCPMKPRCRWRVGRSEVPGSLVPYRLHLSLIENHRDAGQVRQEHVADLGSVEGHYLPEFWEGLEPGIVLKDSTWDLRSAYARVAFWENAKPRLDRLANRLDPKTIRMAIHQRIPWPRQTERDLAETANEVQQWELLNRSAARQIDANGKMIARTEIENAQLRQDMANWAPSVAAATERLTQLKATGKADTPRDPLRRELVREIGARFFSAQLKGS